MMQDQPCTMFIEKKLQILNANKNYEWKVGSLWGRPGASPR